MAVVLNSYSITRAVESITDDLGTGQKTHILEWPGTLQAGDQLSGTGNAQQDLVWSDERTLVATTDALDLRGGLTAAIGGGALGFVEVRKIEIINTHASAPLLVGAGSNPAFAGLFGATGDIVKVPPKGRIAWETLIDGGGLVTTAGTADILTIDSVAATITYKILIAGVSA